MCMAFDKLIAIENCEIYNIFITKNVQRANRIIE